jgi:hypothetical protein
MAMSPRLLRPTFGFNPRQISELGAWFDASDLSTLSQTSDGSTPVTANDDPVAYWKCKATGTALTQAIDASRPLWKSTSDIGSKPGLDFDGSNDYLFATSGDLMKVARNVSGVTIFAVFKTDIANTRAWWHVAVSAGVNQFRSRLSATYNFGFQVGGRRLDADTFLTATTSALATTQPYILRQTLDYANTDLFAHIDGTQSASNLSFQTAGNSPDSDSSYVMIGSQFTNDAFTSLAPYLDGTLCEWIAYKRALTASESASVERYLSNKYGIALA